MTVGCGSSSRVSHRDLHAEQLREGGTVVELKVTQPSSGATFPSSTTTHPSTNEHFTCYCSESGSIGYSHLLQNRETAALVAGSPRPIAEKVIRQLFGGARFFKSGEIAARQPCCSRGRRVKKFDGLEVSL
jgi:hypothetical protein